MVAAGRGWLAIVAMPEQSDSAAGAFQAMSSTADRDTRDTAPPRRCIPPSPSIPHQSGNYQGMFSHKQQAGPSVPVSCSCPCLPPATALMGDSLLLWAN